MPLLFLGNNVPGKLIDLLILHISFVFHAAPKNSSLMQWPSILKLSEESRQSTPGSKKTSAGSHSYHTVKRSGSALCGSWCNSSGLVEQICLGGTLGDEAWVATELEFLTSVMNSTMGPFHRPYVTLRTRNYHGNQLLWILRLLR